MKKLTLLYCVFSLLSASDAFGDDKWKRLNDPPPEAVKLMVAEAINLAEDDKFEESIAKFKQAIADAPNYARAHLEYFYIRSFFLGQFAEVQKEYQQLLSRYPDHPIYLMAIYQRAGIEYARQHFEKVIAVAPDWAWAHYARAMLLREKEPEQAVVELQKCIEKDSGAENAYYALIELQEKRLNRLEDALRTAEKFASQSELRYHRWLQLWRLRLGFAKQSEEAKALLRTELAALLSTSRDYETLRAVREAYKDLLKDPQGIRDAEQKLREVDPQWFPNRGWKVSNLRPNQSGVPRYIEFVNRQVSLYNKVMAARNESQPEEKVSQMEKFLTMNPNEELKRIIYEEIFSAAVKTGAAASALKYSRVLRQIDPDDYGLLARTALALADKRVELPQAIEDARAAEKATAEFKLINVIGFNEARQRENYKKQRALALDALGWTLFRMNRAAEAERYLRQSIELERADKNLQHLAKVLRVAGKTAEAAKLLTEADTMFTEAVMKKLIDQPVEDFQLTSIAGRGYKLSELKGKVVLINFWATWCGPCVQEMPLMQMIYKKYKAEGLEIISISTDDLTYKVGPFAARRKLDFPVFLDTGLKERFAAQAIPVNVFVDREGRARYRKVGYDEDSEREFEIILKKLLK